MSSLQEIENLYLIQRNRMLSVNEPNTSPQFVGVRKVDVDPDPDREKFQGWGFQSHYFQASRMAAQLSYFEAKEETGPIVNRQAFQDCKTNLDGYIASAVEIEEGQNQGFMGWPSDEECSKTGPVREARCLGGSPLWEFFQARYHMRFLADIEMSPSLKVEVDAEYGTWFNDAVDFFRINIFNKWKQNQHLGNFEYSAFYRNRTHIAMEAAEFAMMFSIVTGDNGAREIAENIFFRGFARSSSDTAPLDNFIGQLNEISEQGTTRLEWSQIWASEGNVIQDTNHWGHFVTSITTAYEYGSVQDYDLELMQNFAATWNFTSTDYSKYEQRAFIDGSGIVESRPHTLLLGMPLTLNSFKLFGFDFS